LTLNPACGRQANGPLNLDLITIFIDGQKNPILLTLSNSSDHPDHVGHDMGPIFLEEDPNRSNGHLSEDGRRSWDGGHQHSHMELHQL
jgi:hypothetical protein